VYRRRRNALMGERLELDILNIMYDVASDLVDMAKATQDLENTRMNIYSSLGIDFKIAEDDLKAKDTPVLTKELFDASYQNYVAKNEAMLQKAMPILRDVHAKRGATVKEIMVPITDGLKQ